MCKYSKLVLGKCMTQSVQLSSVESNTMGLNIDIFLKKSYFSFLKLCFICPEWYWQNDNFCVFNPVLPRSKKCPPSPKYWVFFSEFSWKWYVLLFLTLLYLYVFNLGLEIAFCAKTLHGCLVVMKYPPILIKMQAKPSY